MLVSFAKLPAPSRIWVYQMSREVTPADEGVIDARLRLFCDRWERHGKPLKAGFKIFYHRFVVIGVDESFQPIGGCAIDESLRVLRVLQQELGIDFLGRTRVACRIGGVIQIYSANEIKQKLVEGAIDPHTPIFDNLIQTKESLDTLWETPLENSWVAKSFPRATSDR